MRKYFPFERHKSSAFPPVVVAEEVAGLMPVDSSAVVDLGVAVDEEEIAPLAAGDGFSPECGAAELEVVVVVRVGRGVRL